jgi:hypothetical protein
MARGTGRRFCLRRYFGISGEAQSMCPMALLHSIAEQILSACKDQLSILEALVKEVLV